MWTGVGSHKKLELMGLTTVGKKKEVHGEKLLNEYIKDFSSSYSSITKQLLTIQGLVRGTNKEELKWRLDPGKVFHLKEMTTALI